MLDRRDSGISVADGGKPLSLANTSPLTDISTLTLEATMRISPKLVPAAVGAVILYLASTLAHGTPDRLPAVRLVKEDPAALRQVQVKVEWVSAAPAWTKTLTLAATEDQTVTVTLRTGALSQDEDSVTARTHAHSAGQIPHRPPSCGYGYEERQWTCLHHPDLQAGRASVAVQLRDRYYERSGLRDGLVGSSGR